MTELYRNLFKLINTISSDVVLKKLSYNKKLILFSLFSIFNISPFPYNDKILDKKIFNIYNYINGCVLNKFSILNTGNFIIKNYNIFSEENQRFIKMFDIEENNIIIKYDLIIVVFRFIISKLVTIIFQKYFSRIILFPTIYSNNNERFNSLYSSILYYYNNLSYYITIKEIDAGDDDIGTNTKIIKYNSLNKFIQLLYKNFYNYTNRFPMIKKCNSIDFYLNDYLNDLMLFNNIDYNVLYSFLINHDNKKSNNNIYLLIFLLKEKWNIDYNNDYNYNFKNYGKFNYNKLIHCLKIINKGNTNIFISLVLLRRIFPFILSLINLYLNNYNKNREHFMDGYIFNIDELKNSKKNKNIVEKIICFYLSALTKIMIIFSEFGYAFNCNNFKNEEKEEEEEESDDYDFWNKDNRILKFEIDYKGKGICKEKPKMEKEGKDINNKNFFDDFDIFYDIKNINDKIQQIMNKKNTYDTNIINEEKYIPNFDFESNEINEDIIEGNIEEEIEEMSEDEEEEDEEEKFEDKNEERLFIKKNIIIYYTKLFYVSELNKAMNQKNKDCSIKDLKLSFKKKYKENIDFLNDINNDYYYLFEITFYCFYLEFLELYDEIKDKYINEITSFIPYLIACYIKTYEKYSFYINFIDDEGYKAYIRSLYDELFNYLPSKEHLYDEKKFKSYSDLRKFLLTNKKFKLYYTDKSEYINKY